MSRGIFSADWSPEQDFKLLEALEEFGYGNWASVSLKTGKTPSECKDHYDHYYMHRHHHNLPEFPFRLAPSKTTQRSRGVKEEEPVQAYYPGTEISGYMPHRADFAREPDEHAEAIIADLDVGEEEQDDMLDALRLTAIQIYQSRLAKRAFRKRIVKEYGLLDIHKQTAVDASRLPSQQQHLQNISRPFLRFMSPTNAAKYLQSHMLEEGLCSEIKKLQRYRENGITTFKGVSLYERLLSDRKRRKINQKNSIRRNYSAEENLLHQVLHQGTFKFKKTVVKEPKLLDITYSAGVQKLDEQEKELCAHCRFQPEAYLQFKRQLLAECKKAGRLSLAESRKLLKIDVNKTRKVYDLLLAKGLIHNTTSADVT